MIHFSLMAICNGLLQIRHQDLEGRCGMFGALVLVSLNYKAGNSEIVYIMPVKPINTFNFTPINKNIRGKTGSKCFFHTVSLYLPIRNLSHSRQPKYMAVTKYPQPNGFRWCINLRSQQLEWKKLRHLPPPQKKKLHFFQILNNFKNTQIPPLYSNFFHS